MANIALTSVNKLLGLLNEFKEAREEVLIQLKKTQILVTGLKQGLIARQTITGNQTKKEEVESQNEGEELLKPDQVMINLQKSIDQAYKTFKQIKGRNCLSQYLKSKTDLQNIKECYDLLQVAYESLEKEMVIIESAKHQRELKNQMSQAQVMYDNLTSQSARQFIESYFKENFHSIPMVDLSKKFIEYVQNENAKKPENEKFPLINLEPEFQKIIGGNPEGVEVSRINKFYQDIWDHNQNKQAFKEHLLNSGMSKVDKYLLIFQILEGLGLKKYFQLFKQQSITSQMFLLLKQKDIISGFGGKITPADSCSIALSIKQFNQEKKDYFTIKEKAEKMVNDTKNFVKMMIDKREAGQLKKVNPSDMPDTFFGFFAPKGEFQHVLMETSFGSGGVYMESTHDIRIGYVMNKELTDFFPVYRQNKFGPLNSKLVEYSYLDPNASKQGIYYTRKLEPSNDMVYQEQYIETISSNRNGEFEKQKQIMKGITVDGKTETYMCGNYAFNQNLESVVHGKQMQFDFYGIPKLAYFNYGKEISYLEYKQLFQVEEESNFIKKIGKDSEQNIVDLQFQMEAVPKENKELVTIKQLPDYQEQRMSTRKLRLNKKKQTTDTNTVQII